MVNTRIGAQLPKVWGRNWGTVKNDIWGTAKTENWGTAKTQNWGTIKQELGHSKHENWGTVEARIDNENWGTFWRPIWVMIRVLLRGPPRQPEMLASIERKLVS